MSLSKGRQGWNSATRKAAVALLAGSAAALGLLVVLRWHAKPDGAKVFIRYCAPCHQQGKNTGAPSLDVSVK